MSLSASAQQQLQLPQPAASASLASAAAAAGRVASDDEAALVALGNARRRIVALAADAQQQLGLPAAAVNQALVAAVRSAESVVATDAAALADLEGARRRLVSLSASAQQQLQLQQQHPALAAAADAAEGAAADAEASLTRLQGAVRRAEEAAASAALLTARLHAARDSVAVAVEAQRLIVPLPDNQRLDIEEALTRTSAELAFARESRATLKQLVADRTRIVSSLSAGVRPLAVEVVAGLTARVGASQVASASVADLCEAMVELGACQFSALCVEGNVGSMSEREQGLMRAGAAALCSRAQQGVKNAVAKLGSGSGSRAE